MTITADELGWESCKETCDKLRAKLADAERERASFCKRMLDAISDLTKERQDHAVYVAQVRKLWDAFRYFHDDADVDKAEASERELTDFLYPKEQP